MNLRGDRDRGRDSRLPSDFRGELRSVGLELVEERANFALVGVVEAGRFGERCVLVVRVRAAGMGVGLACSVVMVMRGELMQAVADERDAAVMGGEARGQQSSAEITHECHQSAWYSTR